jgi:ParB-like chromosome segregation protein Spo0J
MKEVQQASLAPVVIDAPVKALRLGLSPRFGEQDQEHAEMLAHCLDECPPITIERESHVVIDGIHRVLAARMLGRQTIRAQIFDGTHDQAFLEAVRSNVAHGKPLTRAERESAAKRVLKMDSTLSDRLIGRTCGLSDKTVGRLRRARAYFRMLPLRKGLDGRLRPSSPHDLRDQIAERLRSDSEASSGDIARALGASLHSVRDVRRRKEAGGAPPLAPTRSTSLAGRLTSTDSFSECADEQREPARWSEDRAITTVPGGQVFAAWLDQTEIFSGAWELAVDDLPYGRLPELIAEARIRSNRWAVFASALDERMQRDER